MTRPVPEHDGAPELITPGIYLQTKQGMIGTGGTAKPAEYRTFWATVAISEKSVEFLLLDDDFNPTAIRETMATGAIQPPDWVHIVQGEKRHARIMEMLERRRAAETQSAAVSAPPPAEAESPLSVFQRKPVAAPAKKGAAANSKNNWWDK